MTSGNTTKRKSVSFLLLMLINTPALIQDLLSALPAVLPCLRIEDLQQLPHVSALYLWTSNDRKVLYIGITTDLHWRYNNPKPHKLSTLKKKGATGISWLTLKHSHSLEEMGDARILEAALIQLLQPLLNVEWHPNKKFLWKDKKRPSRKLV